jgi:diguanylate cyclase (GGDEF)-like protein
MPLTLFHRGRLVGFALALFGVALMAMALPDVPRLGIAYLLYLPIALVALATSPLSGAAAGVAGAEVFALGELLADGHGHPDLFSTTAGLRLLTYACIGALVGKFAVDQRAFTARLRSLAERDPLTGLLNTRAHEAALAERISAGKPFALLLADLDGLKIVNDAQGHAAGNDTLRRFADTIAGAVRREDTVARIGGDEFGVLVREAGAQEAMLLSERLESLLLEAGMGASFGYAIWPEDAADARTLFERADARLYDRKAARAGNPGTARMLDEVSSTVPARSLG